MISVALSQLIDIGYSETRYNVLDYGAIGDGQTDDSEVTSLVTFFSFSYMFYSYVFVWFSS